MKHASWIAVTCLVVAGIVAPPAHAQQTRYQYALPAGSVGTMASNDPTSTYSAYIKDPSEAQVRTTWGLDVPNKSHFNRYIHDPTPAQVTAAWGDPNRPHLSSYNPYHAVGK